MNAKRSSNLYSKFHTNPESKPIVDSSITNLSGIMFIVESEGKRMLFTGSCLGSDIVESLSLRGLLDSEGKLHVDVLKVPYHGEKECVRAIFRYYYC